MQDEELQGEHSSVQNSADNPSLGSSTQPSENHQNQRSSTRKESML